MTTGNHQPRVRIRSLQPTDLLARFAFRLGGHRAGIEYDDIGLGGVARDLVTQLQEAACPGFQLGLVEPAAQRLKINQHFDYRYGKKSADSNKITRCMQRVRRKKSSPHKWGSHEEGAL